ncbi:MAG: L-xylulokinase [Solirubrobacteraceae bacterium]|nr:L-xylulokinase [Solirubrobacteraceae bacterium]
MSRYLMGIDSGLTVTKAVIFEPDGRAVASAGIRVPQHLPEPRWVERDIDELWAATGEAVRTALQRAGATGDDVIAIAATAHGDGVYLLDDDLRPARRGIVSLDSRAHRVVERWNDGPVPQRALRTTGQVPHVSSPAALLAWVAETEPDVFERTRWALACKDVIKLRLTGEVTADPTEASTAFCDVRTQTYSDEAFELYGLDGARGMLAPVVASTEIAGEVTPAAAELTGLRAGTPVVSGLHDVDASAIGTGVIRPGQLSIVAGSYSINETVADHPVTDERWMARNFVRPGQWMHMAISPASATNLEWFVQRLTPEQTAAAEASGGDPFAMVTTEVGAILDEPSSVVFLPFLYGSPEGPAPSATFLGLRGWHHRGHVLRAILEGIAFNHRWHIDDLRSSFPVDEARLTGGAARSPIWSQIFADSLGLEIIVTEADEAGALGAALCAGVGAGEYASLDDGVARAVRDVARFAPAPQGVARLEEAYQTFRRATEALAEVWPRLA